MCAVTCTHQTRDLATFAQMLREVLSSNPTIPSHLAALYDTLLEQNLLRIVEPYSVVEIEFVAQQVRQGRKTLKQSTPLPLVLVSHELIVDSRDRLSQMMLDKFSM